jgi:hypothetical protein
MPITMPLSRALLVLLYTQLRTRRACSIGCLEALGIKKKENGFLATRKWLGKSHWPLCEMHTDKQLVMGAGSSMPALLR